MTTVHELNPDHVIVPKRQRGFFDNTYIQELAESIKSIGQLQPGVCKRDDMGDPVLIAGECRLKACKIAQVPFRFIFKEDITDPAMLHECELMENLLRRPLTWQEEVNAKAEWHRLKQDKHGTTTVGREGGHTIEDTARDLHESKGIISEDLTLSMFAREIPEVAQAKNKTEAKKIIKRLKGEVERYTLLQEAQAKEAEKATEGGVDLQELRLREYAERTIHADFDEWVTSYTGKPFDVVLFDPPWGVDFNKVKQENVSQRDYEDSKEEWEVKFPIRIKSLYDIMGENSHLYLFFGIALHETVYKTLEDCGFSTNRIPLIWHKQGAHRTRNPTIWPGRSYEPIAYARKGGKDLQKQGASDIITTPQPTPKLKQIHPSAKHPAIYRELLSRSALPGDRVLDPMCGSGMAAVACDALKQTLQLDWTVVEKEEHFRNLTLYNLYQGYFKIVDDVEGEDPEDKEAPVDTSDFRHLSPGTPDWMNYWRLNPHKQDEMLAFKRGRI